ncbi:polyprotein [Elysia marginata]|uniref:Polyprotein n=1 Tax=Elysia marginata TaxID=1093978 RepID=A0AAV4FRQ3_9GAST|nr:polyprotein [Elysia marginata]
MVNYYSHFIKNLSSSLAPLYTLLRKDKKWTWRKEQAEAFKHSKNLLTSNMLLVHYDLNKPIILTCDASPYGISAIVKKYTCTSTTTTSALELA